MNNEIKEVRARVIQQEKGLYTIEYDGETKKAEVSGKFRYDTERISDYPAVGDFVVATWPTDGSNSIISSIFPRKSEFIRKAAGPGNHEQVVASNVDTVFLCMSLNNDFNLRRLERYLSISWNSGAIPVVVLTKSDLCDEIESKILEVSSVAAGVDILTVSSRNGDIESVKPFLLPEKTVAFIGSSGVGKSTLINSIVGNDVIKTAEIREDDDKGRHTTTHRELIKLENGAYVIDTPGMREIGLWNSDEGVETVFSDIEDMSQTCRFSDCSHTNEPGCSILAALEDGSLSMDRWNSYQKLVVENLYNSNSEGYLKQKKAKFKAISQYNKSRKK